MQCWEDTSVESPWFSRRFLSSVVYNWFVRLPLAFWDQNFLMMLFSLVFHPSSDFWIFLDLLDSFIKLDKEDRGPKDTKSLNILWKWESGWMKELDINSMTELLWELSSGLICWLVCRQLTRHSSAVPCPSHEGYVRELWWVFSGGG